LPVDPARITDFELVKLGQEISVELPTQLEGSVGELTLTGRNSTGLDFGSLSIENGCACMVPRIIGEADCSNGEELTLKFKIVATLGGFSQTAVFSGVQKGREERVVISRISVSMKCVPPFVCSGRTVFFGDPRRDTIILRPSLEDISIGDSDIQVDSDAVQIVDRTVLVDGSIRLRFDGPIPPSDPESFALNVPFRRGPESEIAWTTVMLKSLPKIVFDVSPFLLRLSAKDGFLEGKVIVTETLSGEDPDAYVLPEARLVVANRESGENREEKATLYVVRRLSDRTILSVRVDADAIDPANEEGVLEIRRATAGTSGMVARSQVEL
jgi:hypothetical protein